MGILHQGPLVTTPHSYILLCSHDHIVRSYSSTYSPPPPPSSMSSPWHHDKCWSSMSCTVLWIHDSCVWERESRWLLGSWRGLERVNKIPNTRDDKKMKKKMNPFFTRIISRRKNSKKFEEKKLKIFRKFSIIFSKINPPLSFYVVLDGPGLSLVVLRWSYVVPWGPMRSYEVLWGPMRSYEVLWGPMRSYEVLWGPMRSYVVLCGPMWSYVVISMTPMNLYWNISEFCKYQHCFYLSPCLVFGLDM